MSKFIRNGSIYLSANILNAAIPFLLLPILTRYLSVEEYGQLAMFQLLIAGLVGFVGLNTVGAAGRKFFDENVSELELAIYNTNCLWILLFTGAITALLSLLFNEKVVLLLSIPSHWVYLAITVSFSTFIIQLRLSQWQIRGEAKKYGFLQVGNSLFNFCGSLIFVVSFSMGAQGRIEAQFITGIVISLVSLYLLVRQKLLAFTFPNRKQISEALNFGVPLVPHVFGIFLLSSADRYVINENLGLAAAGVYLLAIQLSGALYIVFDAINKSYVPYLFSALRDNNADVKIKIVKYTYYYFITLIVIAVVGFYVAPHVLLFIAGDKFKDAGEVIGWLLVSQIFGGMYLMVTNYIFYSKETKLLSFITIITGILNVILLYILIPKFGIKGAAFSSCIAMLARFLFTWIIATSKVDMPWSLNKISRDI